MHLAMTRWMISLRRSEGRCHLRRGDARHALTCSASQQRRFPVGDRRNTLRIVASPNGRNGSLTIAMDASVCSAALQVGEHIAHELVPAPRSHGAEELEC